jgi:hypothetical protein
MQGRKKDVVYALPRRMAEVSAWPERCLGPLVKRKKMKPMEESFINLLMQNLLRILTAVLIPAFFLRIFFIPLPT